MGLKNILWKKIQYFFWELFCFNIIWKNFNFNFIIKVGQVDIKSEPSEEADSSYKNENSEEQREVIIEIYSI